MNVHSHTEPTVQVQESRVRKFVLTQQPPTMIMNASVHCLTFSIEQNLLLWFIQMIFSGDCSCIESKLRRYLFEAYLFGYILQIKSRWICWKEGCRVSKTKQYCISNHNHNHKLHIVFHKEIDTFRFIKVLSEILLWFRQQILMFSYSWEYKTLYWLVIW